MKLVKIYKQPSMKLIFKAWHDNATKTQKERQKEIDEKWLNEKANEIIRSRMLRFTSKIKRPTNYERR